jgi:RecA-family ATPase
VSVRSRFFNAPADPLRQPNSRATPVAKVVRLVPKDADSTGAIDLTEPASLSDCEIPVRRWVVEGLIPANTVTMLGGDGGVGKSLLAMQLATACAMGGTFLGLNVERSRVLAIFCEDSVDELHRRQAQINRAKKIAFGDLRDIRWASRVSSDNTLIRFGQNDEIEATSLLSSLRVRLTDFQPGLLILDGLSDVFAGNENNRGHAKRFIANLSGLCVDHALTVLLLAHPSLAGLNSGSGASGSTGWNAAVRSRLFLERPKGDGDFRPDEALRVLRVKKSNYGRSEIEINLRWNDGVFEPIETESSLDRATRQSRAERMFLELIGSFAREGRNVTSGPTSPNFAPKLFAKRPEAEGLNRFDMTEAMERLFSKGVIREESRGKASRPVRCIVRVAGNSVREESE